jgi:prepilin-type N-terminal cleavage/methylation domain-containing protein
VGTGGTGAQLGIGLKPGPASADLERVLAISGADRSRRRRERDGGFTLIELLVVMVVIAILAAIAIPVVRVQREKAADTAVRSDLGTLGKELAGWFGQSTAVPSLAIVAGQYQLAGANVSRVSGAAAIVTSFGAAPTTTASTADTTGWTATDWCVALSDPHGSVKTFKFSAANGLETGQCGTASTP